mgnify:CR=1 FL=1
MKIKIFYWHLSKFDDLPWKHGEVIEPFYLLGESLEVGQLLLKIATQGYTSMFRPLGDNTFILYIGKGKLTQR